GSSWNYAKTSRLHPHPVRRPRGAPGEVFSHRPESRTRACGSFSALLPTQGSEIASVGHTARLLGMKKARCPRIRTAGATFASRRGIYDQLTTPPLGIRSGSAFLGTNCRWATS